ncbi:Beta-lactamase/transpeptidase-like protein [Naviculisporaceae sp. PSN 640]
MDPGPSEECSRGRKEVVRCRLEAHTELISKLMHLGNSPGVSYAVLCEGEVVLLGGQGYADLEKAIPAGPETIYPIASITKTLTASACGFLVTEGLISWNDVISSHIPEFQPIHCPDAAKMATLVDILCHRTALSDEVCFHMGPNGIPIFEDDKTLLSMLNALPGEKEAFRKVWKYNPLPYALVSRLVRSLTGQSFAEFLESRIFSPLGMKSTSLIGEPLREDGAERTEHTNLARPYTATTNGSFTVRDVPPAAYRFPFDAPMGIQSSVVDMIQWARAVILAYRADAGSAVAENSKIPLLPEMRHILYPWCPLAPNPGGSPAYCLGLFRTRGYFLSDDIFDLNEGDEDGERDEPRNRYPSQTCLPFPRPRPDQAERTIFFHSGTGNGFTSSLHIFPEAQDAVVVLSNSSLAGDAADSVSLLLTSLLNGYELDLAALETATKGVADFEVSRWGRIVADLEEQRRINPRGTGMPPPNQLVGVYTEEVTGLTIRIEEQDHGIDEVEDSRGVERSYIGVSVKFGTVTDIGLRLWSFCDDTFCFLPSERDFQTLGLGYMSHWCQFLVHLDADREGQDVSGLWWQYNPKKDGSWFQKVST